MNSPHSSSSSSADENEYKNRHRNRHSKKHKKKKKKSSSKSNSSSISKKHKKYHSRRQSRHSDSDSDRDLDDDDHLLDCLDDNFGNDVINSEVEKDDIIKSRRDKKKSSKHHHRHRSKSSSYRRHRRKRHKRDDDDDNDNDTNNESDESESSDQSSDQRKKKRKKKHKRQRKHTSSKDDGHIIITQISNNTSSSSPLATKYDNLLPLLQSLLSKHNDLAMELPYLLIKLCSGSSINLSQIPDSHVVSALQGIFTCLGCTYTQQDNSFIFDDHGRWKKNDNDDERSLVLIKLVRFLLNEAGVTMEAIQEQEYQEKMKNDVHIIAKERDQRMLMLTSKNTSGSNEKHDNLNSKNPEGEANENNISTLVTMLLDLFQPKQEIKASSLAKELYDIMNMILDGEIICIDGIPDQNLRFAMEKLFMMIGLVKEEMEEDDDSDDDDDDDDNHNGNAREEDNHVDEKNTDQSSNNERKDDKEVPCGYTLPTTTETLGNDEVKINIAEIVKDKLIKSIQATKSYHQSFLHRLHDKQDGKARRRMMGPSMPPSNSIAGSFEKSDVGKEQNDEDEEDDDGPAPLGSSMARARQIKGHGRNISNSSKLSEKSILSLSATNKREEWMMEPGEHDFLQGVMSSGTIKNRKFKNEKNRSAASVQAEAPMDDNVKREVDSIIKAHEEARGPSLITQHRKKIAQEKAAKATVENNGKKGSDWNWSRDSDLDQGRRVDKNYLNMVLGGASTELRNKFQGSYSKGFM